MAQPRGSTQASRKHKAHCTVEQSQFRFLDLPAEVRNRIYDFVVGEDTVKIKRLHPSHWPRYNLQRLSLAQVCSQIRTEVRSLLVAHTTFAVQPHNVYACVHTFVAPPYIDLDNAVGRVEIHHPGQLTTLDLKPLMQLYNIAKDVSIVFKDANVEAMDGEAVQDMTMKALLEERLVHDWSAFSAFVEREVCSIDADLDNGRVNYHDERGNNVNTCNISGLTVRVSCQYWRPWLGHWDDEWFYMPQEQRTRWSKEIKDWNSGTAGPDWAHTGHDTIAVSFEKADRFDERLRG